MLAGSLTPAPGVLGLELGVLAVVHKALGFIDKGDHLFGINISPKKFLHPSTSLSEGGDANARLAESLPDLRHLVRRDNNTSGYVNV